MDPLAPDSFVQWTDRPKLRRPVLVAAFEGWNDAADGATAGYLKGRWQARQFASIDPEEFFDFSATRPRVRLTETTAREIVWPANEFWAASLPDSPRDVILSWAQSRSSLADVLRPGGLRRHQLGVEMLLTLVTPPENPPDP